MTRLISLDKTNRCSSPAYTPQFSRQPGVEWVALTAGGSDFVLLVRVPDAETLRDVVLEGLQGIPGVRSTQTMFVLDELDGRGEPSPRPPSR